MRVYKIRTIPVDTHFHELKDENGNIDILPVDQFSGKSFMLNPCGFPMNDVMAFEESQSDDIARAVLARTQVYDKGQGDGLSLEERFAAIVPATWSSPAEFVRAQTSFAKMYLDKQARLQEEKQAEIEQHVSDVRNKENIVVDPE